MKLLLVAIAVFFTPCVEKAAQAGFLLAPSAKWAVFSAQPEEDEKTPNYHAWAVGLSLGYSIRQVFDVAAFGSYSPGNPNKAEFGSENAVLYMYGGEMAGRIKESVYFAIRGGQAVYQLFRQREPEELTGKWQGNTAGFSLGAFWEANKSNYLQTSFDFAHIIAKRVDEADENGESRKLDQFSISFTYVFNGFKNYLIDDSFFGEFLKSF